MNIKLTHKLIQEMCGTVSFKRGDSFYLANKVIIEKYSPNVCNATVVGTENFHVSIETDTKGNLRTKCSCPKLASFQKDCQHIAAVLISIYEHQRRETLQISTETLPPSSNQDLSEGLLTLFNNQPKRSSGQQLHFENRQVLEAEFICKPVPIKPGQNMLGIELKVGDAKVMNIRDFLKDIAKGKPSMCSITFTFDPGLYCFQKESYTVIQQLIEVVHDEKVFKNSLPDRSDYRFHNQNDLLLIPPTSWESLIPHLLRTPLVTLECDGKIYKGLNLSRESLPLQFDFTKTMGGTDYLLKIKGLDQIIVLNSYQSVIYKGKFIQLEKEDSERLADLIKLLDASGTNQIPIRHEQKDFFLEKVVPGLKKLGNVQLSGEITTLLPKTPLIPKLYLDRVKNRLLAGLEFHYENIVINPLENRELWTNTVLVRDLEKEDEILELMEDSSFAKTDGGYLLHNEELEYEFLYHVVPKLQKLVQIYATTAVRNRIFKGNQPPQIRIKVKKERTNWLEFKFEMDGIPEKQIRDVLSALEEKRKFYRLRNGSLLSLETREFEAIKRFLNEQPIQAEDLESGLNMPIVSGLRFLDFVEDQNVLKIEDSFRQFLEKLRNPDSLEFEVPKRLDSILRDYQKQGYKWMKSLASYGFGGILADSMGLGKTLQSIAFILSVHSDIRKRKLPVLIVCPSSLTYNWLSELMKFTPEIEALVIDGKQAERLELQKAIQDVDVVITSYPLLRRDINWFKKQAFHTVFFDEAQAFKNPVTQTARAVKKIKAEHRFALTGTPVENSLEELWSIFHVVFPELFQGLKEYSHLSKEAIARRTRPFLLRRQKEDVLRELPEKMESMETVDLLPDQKKLYAAYLVKLKHDTLKHLDKDTMRKNRIKILAGLTRLRQICCHPALFVDGYQGRSAKFEQLLQILKESKLSGRRVLIFSQFTKMLALIGRELSVQGESFFYLDGQTPSAERLEICNRFNAGERDLFLISLKAGGTGLNLTGADTVILYDIWWNPAVEEQAADRAHRIGQENVVQVIKLVAKGTIEEKMNELQQKKRHLIEAIIESDGKTSSTLTDEDIRELLMI
ncbi:SNF2 helicase associated domain-containing protein [Neobacillus sp. LXY-4]|uniref:DEAD/DEAH box helicase n=1 Tax=Neobacillus sp. LXY-4 TaxID=3379826 RepID=UPI003EE4187D